MRSCILYNFWVTYLFNWFRKSADGTFLYRVRLRIYFLLVIYQNLEFADPMMYIREYDAQDAAPHKFALLRWHITVSCSVGKIHGAKSVFVKWCIFNQTRIFLIKNLWYVKWQLSTPKTYLERTYPRTLNDNYENCCSFWKILIEFNFKSPSMIADYFSFYLVSADYELFCIKLLIPKHCSVV